MRKYDDLINKLLLILTVVCVIWGGPIALIQKKFFGIIPTVYRVFIPLITMYLLFRRFFVYKQKLKGLSKLFILFMLMMAFWIVYGVGGVILSPYSPVKEGMKEIMNLILGACSVYCIFECCRKREDINLLFACLRISCVLMCALSLFEMFTNLHLPSSELFTDNSIIVANDKSYISGLFVDNVFLSTGVFYGVNDLAVMLCLYIPLFYYRKGDKPLYVVYKVLVVITILFILAVNDANIAIMASMAALIMNLAFSIKADKAYGISAASGMGVLLIMQLWGEKLIHKGISAVKGKIWSLDKSGLGYTDMQKIIGMEENAQQNMNSIGTVINGQIQNYKGQFGSLYLRLCLMRDSIDMTISTYGLGVGPAGFMQYLRINPGRKYLVNPHNWWFEILTQYGVFVFAAYVGVMIKLFIDTVKAYLKSKDYIFGVIIALIVTLVIASVAPSSFLGYSYQWLVPALGIAALNICYTQPEKTQPENEEQK